MLRMSSLFLRTLREDPSDAEVPSHKLLVRAGLVRRVAPGIFSWLPLGYLIYRNVERVVRAEMDAAGFQEVHFPALLPKDAYEATNRWEEYGPSLFRLQDRKGADYLLGPTHEEMFTLMVKGEYSSYKDLPLSIYQIQTKYRDEARPRSGIIRGREFVMKDSYSFDMDEAGLEISYQKHRDAYIKTFERLGLKFNIGATVDGFNREHTEFLTEYFIASNTEHKPFYMDSISYKKDTDIFEESQQYQVCQNLLDAGYEMYVEPNSKTPAAIIDSLTQRYGHRIRFVELAKLDANSIYQIGF